jgi:hypothetical protein
LQLTLLLVVSTLMTLQWLSRLIHQRNTRPTYTVQVELVVLVSRELLLLWFLVHADVRLKTCYAEQNVKLFTLMFAQIAQSLLKSQVLLHQLRLQALWTSVTAVVVHAKAAVAVQTVVHLEVAHATSVVVVVHVVVQEMVHVQVEDQQVSLLESHQVDQLEIAKSLYQNNPKGNLGVICLTGT